MKSASENKILQNGFRHTAVFSNRLSGNMSLSYADTKNSLENRKIFLEAFNIDYRDLVCAKQIHSNRVHYVKKEDKGKGALCNDNAIENADAFITKEKNIPLAIFSADCLSVFLYDADNCAVALIHAGWRSVRDGIISSVISSMQREFNTQAYRLNAGLGPCIRDCCYKVGKELEVYFAGYVSKKNGFFYLDLASCAKDELLNSGVKRELIDDCGICTSCRNEDFFSFRREGDRCGRMISVIMLKGK